MIGSPASRGATASVVGAGRACLASRRGPIGLASMPGVTGLASMRGVIELTSMRGMIGLASIPGMIELAAMRALTELPSVRGMIDPFRISLHARDDRIGLNLWHDCRMANFPHPALAYLHFRPTAVHL